MAFYNFGLRLLRRVQDAEQAGQPFLTVEQAVYKLTGELAEWFNLDAGRLRVGDRADLAVIDPLGLDAHVDDYAEATMTEFGDLRRMVNRNDAAVTATLVNGKIVWADGLIADGLGSRVGPGRFLRAGVPSKPRPAERAVSA